MTIWDPLRSEPVCFVPINDLTAADAGAVAADGITSIASPGLAGAADPHTTLGEQFDNTTKAAASGSDTAIARAAISVHPVIVSAIDDAADGSVGSGLSPTIETRLLAAPFSLASAVDSGLVADDVTSSAHAAVTDAADMGAGAGVPGDGVPSGRGLAEATGESRLAPVSGLDNVAASSAATGVARPVITETADEGATATAADVPDAAATIAPPAMTQAPALVQPAANDGGAAESVADMGMIPPIATNAGDAITGQSPTSATLRPAATVTLAPTSDSGAAGDGITRITRPTLTGVASPGAAVSVRTDGALVGMVLADATGAWSRTWPTALTAGVHMVTASAVDATGSAAGTASLPLTIDTSCPPPTLAWEDDAPGVGAGAVTQPCFAGTAKPGATVCVQIDGTQVGTTLADAAGRWSAAPAAAMGTGRHVVTAAAVDVAGNTSAVTRIAIDTALPAPTLGLTPASDSGVAGDGITSVYRPVFTGVVAAGCTLAIAIDGYHWGTVSPNAGGVWTWTSTIALTGGSHIITATAVDAAGDASAATNMPLTIDFSTPQPTLALAAASDDGVAGDFHTTVAKPTFAGAAEAGATVSLQVDGTLIGTSRAGASGTWSLTQATALSVGKHVITAAAVDVAGNTSTTAYQGVTIDAGAPAIPQPAVAGDIVGLVLQNNQASVLAPREITFAQAFTAGQVRPGDALAARLNGTLVAVQMDVKTTNPDGSVATAVLTMRQPALAAGTSLDVMLTRAAAVTAPSVDIAALTTGAYHFAVDLTLHNANGTTTPVHIDAGTALAAALKSGNLSYWQAGPQATQVRVDVPVSGSLHVTFDMTAYADGTTSTDVQFNNDLAMTASGGTVNYDATIAQNGAVAFTQANITQYQYQTWHRQIWSNGAPQVNVQHDIAALERTGLIQAYDLSTGVAASLVSSEAAALNGPGFGVLGNAQITQYMPMTGGRPDIGPTTAANAAWLLTQNQTAAQYALAQADAAGSVPWHMFDPQSGAYVRVTDYPKLWPDSRAANAGDYNLTQPVAPSEQTGWWPDPAHEPDLDYVAYLMTGSRYYLDQLNAEANYDILWSSPSGRHDAQGLVINPYTEARAQGWSLREIAEAAAANPDGSAEKAYFTTILNNNFAFLLNEVLATHQGEASGWIPAGGGVGRIQPWQQDYFATTIDLAATLGVTDAKDVLLWEQNFITGRFLQAAQGFDPNIGIGYYIEMFDPALSQATPYQTWAQIAALTNAIRGQPAAPGTWYADYAVGALASVAGEITVTGSPESIHAYGIILANTPSANLAYQQEYPCYNIVPRLPDGQFLTSDHVIVSADTIAAQIHGSDADQLIYETGAGNVTIIGGAGINILFAGSGADTLQGGPNRDYLYGGSGADRFMAGAGNNYMEAGTGAAVFVLAAADAADDLIADFKIGVDQMVVTGAAPAGAIIAGATTDAAGSAVLHLSAVHDVTLQGIAVGQLTASLFG